MQVYRKEVNIFTGITIVWHNELPIEERLSTEEEIKEAYLSIYGCLPF